MLPQYACQPDFDAEERHAPVVDAAPFRALRYDPAVAGPAAATSAPAYDDLERFAYARHRTASPYTVLELLAAEPGATVDPYRSAAAAFRRWRRTGVLLSDEQPAFYRYDIHELRHGTPAVVRGVLAAVAVGDGSLLAHESVDPRRVNARVQRMAAVPADLAPLYAVHQSAPPVLRDILDAPPSSPPLIALTDEAGADHRIWAISDATRVDQIRRALKPLRALIADGHHRHAAAVVSSRRHPMQNRTLAYLVDSAAHAPQLRAIHRLVSPFGPSDLDRLAELFALQKVTVDDVAARLASIPQTSVAFGLISGSASAWLLRAHDDENVRRRLPPDRGPHWRSLDAAVWECAVRPLTAGTVDYRSDVPTATQPVPGDSALFLLRPPAIADVYACAVAGEAMPTKTTWFRPKPRAGLVMRSLQSVHDLD